MYTKALMLVFMPENPPSATEGKLQETTKNATAALNIRLIGRASRLYNGSESATKRLKDWRSAECWGLIRS